MDEPINCRDSFEVSVSFGRFENDELSWEKWSSFSPNKYVEEIVNLSMPGSVARKASYFDDYYKKIAARKAAELAEQEKLKITSPSETSNDDHHVENSGGISREISSSDSERLVEEVDDGAEDDKFGSSVGVERGGRDELNKSVVENELGVGLGVEILRLYRQIVEKSPEVRKNVSKQSTSLQTENSKPNARRIVQKADRAKKETNSTVTKKKVTSPSVSACAPRNAKTTSTSTTSSTLQCMKKKAHGSPLRMENSKSNARRIDQKVTPAKKETNLVVTKSKVASPAVPASAPRNAKITSASTTSFTLQCTKPKARRSLLKTENSKSNASCIGQKVSSTIKETNSDVTKKKVATASSLPPRTAKVTSTSTTSSTSQRMKKDAHESQSKMENSKSNACTVGRKVIPAKKETNSVMTKKKVASTAVPMMSAPRNAKTTSTSTTSSTSQPMKKEAHGSPLKMENSKLNAGTTGRKATLPKKERNSEATTTKVVTPALPVSTPRSTNTTSNTTKPKSHVLPLPKTDNFLGRRESKGAAPTSSRTSCSLGPAKSSSSTTGKMENTGDKYIVRLVSKTLINRASNENSNTRKQTLSTKSEAKVSDPLSRSKGQERSYKKSLPEKENTIAVSPSIGLRSIERADTRKDKILKRLEVKPIARDTKNARLGAKSKGAHKSETKTPRRNLDSKA